MHLAETEEGVSDALLRIAGYRQSMCCKQRNAVGDLELRLFNWSSSLGKGLARPVWLPPSNICLSSKIRKGAIGDQLETSCVRSRGYTDAHGMYHICSCSYYKTGIGIMASIRREYCSLYCFVRDYHQNWLTPSILKALREPSHSLWHVLYKSKIQVKRGNV